MDKQARYDLLFGLISTFPWASSVTKGTMMGFPCLRADGQFFACLDREGDDLIVKLPAERVRELVEEAVGQSFAPAGRVFKEWVALPPSSREHWPTLMAEAQAFVAGA